MRCGTSASDVFTGLYAFGAISAALYDREKTGKGQFIDVAMLDATFSCLENAVINTCVFGTDPQRVGNSHPPASPSGRSPPPMERSLSPAPGILHFTVCAAPWGGRIWWRTRASPRRRPDASTRRS